MYKFVRSARAQGAKMLQALQFAMEVNQYVKKKYPEAGSAQVFTAEFGDIGTIYWTADYKDLATMEALRGKIMADSEYWAILEKATGLFIEGSVHDRLLRQA